MSIESNRSQAPQPDPESPHTTTTGAEVRKGSKFLNQIKAMVRKSGAIPQPTVENTQAPPSEAMTEPNPWEWEDNSEDPTIILPSQPLHESDDWPEGVTWREDEEGAILSEPDYPNETPPNSTERAHRSKHSNRRFIVESMRSEADSYFKARTPYSRRGKILDEISKITEDFKKVPEDENTTDKPRELNLFETSSSEDQTKMTTFLEANTSRVEQIRKEALDSQEKVLDMRYGLLPVKFLANRDLTKIRKEIMEYQKKITQLSALYSGEANLSKPDNDKYVQNTPVRRRALEYGQAIDTRLRILAAIAGEPYFTTEQTNELLNIESEAKKIRDDILVTRPTETKTTPVGPEVESVQTQFREYFDKSWLSSTLMSIAQEAQERVKNKRLTPSEMQDIKGDVVGETLDEILARDPSTTAYRAQLKAELEKIFFKHL